MRMILESFLVFIFLIYTCYVSAEYIAVNKEIGTARSFHAACIDSIENSGFDDGVISEWTDKADEYGFILKTKDLSVQNVDKVTPCYYITLTYNIGINLLGVHETSTIRGYAR